MGKLEKLRDMLRGASAGSRELDAYIEAQIAHPDEWNWQIREDPSLIRDLSVYSPTAIAPYTTSLDAIVGLVQSKLPGWAWKIGTCCVSDDAWLVPDFNCPTHGEQLRAQFGYPERVNAGSIWDNGIDIDRRPPGNVPLAMCEAFVSALIALAKEPTP